jgi:hypothetical protein
MSANETQDVKLSPGGPAELISLSATGALVETTTRLVVGATTSVCIGGARPQKLPGRVTRCQVCGIHRNNTMTYQLAIEFQPSTEVDLGDVPAAASSGADLVAPALVAPQPPPELVNEW